MHSWRVTAKWDERLTGTIQGLRKQDVAILVASDEVNIPMVSLLKCGADKDVPDTLSFQDDIVCSAERGHKLP